MPVTAPHEGIGQTRCAQSDSVVSKAIVRQIILTFPRLCLYSRPMLYKREATRAFIIYAILFAWTFVGGYILVEKVDAFQTIEQESQEQESQEFEHALVNLGHAFKANVPSDAEATSGSVIVDLISAISAFTYDARSERHTLFLPRAPSLNRYQLLSTYRI